MSYLVTIQNVFLVSVNLYLWTLKMTLYAPMFTNSTHAVYALSCILKHHKYSIKHYPVPSNLCRCSRVDKFLALLQLWGETRSVRLSERSAPASARSDRNPPQISNVSPRYLFWTHPCGSKTRLRKLTAQPVRPCTSFPQVWSRTPARKRTGKGAQNKQKHKSRNFSNSWSIHG